MAWSRRIRRKPIENYALRKIDTQRSTLCYELLYCHICFGQSRVGEQTDNSTAGLPGIGCISNRYNLAR